MVRRLLSEKDQLTSVFEVVERFVEGEQFVQAAKIAERTILDFRHNPQDESEEDLARLDRLGELGAIAFLKEGRHDAALRALELSEMGRNIVLRGVLGDHVPASSVISTHRAGVPQNGVVVRILIGPKESFVLYVKRNGPVHFEQLPLTRAIVDQWLHGDGVCGGYWPVYEDFSLVKDRSGSSERRDAFNNEVERLRVRFWDELMLPVHTTLRNELKLDGGHTPVVLILPGDASAFPVEAAGPDASSAFSDFWTASRVPSLSMLAQQEAYRNCCCDKAISAAAFLDPVVAGYSVLRGAAFEGKSLKARLPRGHYEAFNEEKSSVDAFVTQFADADHLLVSMHAMIDRANPKSTKLLMSQHEELTIAQMIARLPIISGTSIHVPSCEAGTPADITGLRSIANVFFGKGAAAVSAPCWQIFDDESFVLTHFFYEEWLKDGWIQCSVALAMRKAIRRVRRINIAELQEIWHPVVFEGEKIPYSIDVAWPCGRTSRDNKGTLGGDAGHVRRSAGPKVWAGSRVANLSDEHECGSLWYERLRKHRPGAFVFKPSGDQGYDYQPFADAIFWAGFCVVGV